MARCSSAVLLVLLGALAAVLGAAHAADSCGQPPKWPTWVYLEKVTFALNCTFNSNDILPESTGSIKNVVSGSCGGHCEHVEECTHFTWMPNGDVDIGTCSLKKGTVSLKDAVCKILDGSTQQPLCGIKKSAGVNAGVQPGATSPPAPSPQPGNTTTDNPGCDSDCIAAVVSSVCSVIGVTITGFFGYRVVKKKREHAAEP